jgi:leucine-rich repeat protein SHOC2
MCNGGHRYCIFSIPGEMPNWLSYSGEGCPLSFHIPPVCQGLVVWFVRPLEKDDHYYLRSDTIIIIIRNKSNGIQLFEDIRTPQTAIPNIGGWIRYISRSEMAMEDYCGDDEWKITVEVRTGHSFEPVHVKECGVHVIAGKLDSFEESAVERDTVMSSSPLYHLLPHPHYGSITASTPKQWSDYLCAKLHKYNLSLALKSKNKYFI